MRSTKKIEKKNNIKEKGGSKLLIDIEKMVDNHTYEIYPNMLIEKCIKKGIIRHKLNTLEDVKKIETNDNLCPFDFGLCVLYYYMGEFCNPEFIKISETSAQAFAANIYYYWDTCNIGSTVTYFFAVKKSDVPLDTINYINKVLEMEYKGSADFNRPELPMYNLRNDN